MKDKRLYHNTMDVSALDRGPVGLSGDVIKYHEGNAARYAEEILRKCRNATYANMVAVALARLVIEAKQTKQEDARPDWRETFSEMGDR